jgi:hypothetical protein
MCLNKSILVSTRIVPNFQIVLNHCPMNKTPNSFHIGNVPLFWHSNLGKSAFTFAMFAEKIQTTAACLGVFGHFFHLSPLDC